MQRYCPTLYFLTVFAITMSLPLKAQSAPDLNQVPNIVQDYIYGYAPVAMWATREILTAVPDNSGEHQAPINQFAYGKTLADPSERLIVDPNADSLFTEAWLDLTKEPIILHVPDTAGRFYLIPMLDAYSNEFASVGSRTTGTSAGNYAIVGPAWNGLQPGNVTAVIKAPSNTVWLLGRTLVNGPADLSAAVQLTSQYNLIPLSAYPEFLRTGQYNPPTNVPVTQPKPDFVGFPVTAAPGFSMPEFFDALAQYAIANPPPANQYLQASALVLDGYSNRKQLTPDAVAEANDAMAAEAQSAVTEENGWAFNLKVGKYGTDYLLRAAVAKFGFAANDAADAVYMHALTDITNVPLTGSNSYVIHFDPGQTPPAHGYWSVTVYDQNGFLIANPINRYSLGSQSGLVQNPDGSLDIFLQNSQPSTLQSNWLPVPTGSFNLSLRIYWPDQAVLNGAWTPPTLSRTTSVATGN